MLVELAPRLVEGVAILYVDVATLARLVRFGTDQDPLSMGRCGAEVGPDPMNRWGTFTPTRQLDIGSHMLSCSASSRIFEFHLLRGRGDCGM